MKPSEYLIKEGYWIISDMPNIKLEDGEGYRVDSVADELDNKFIDREELLSWLKLELEEVEAENIRYGKRNIKDKLCDGASFALRDVIAKIISSNTEEFVTNRNKSKKEILDLLK